MSIAENIAQVKANIARAAIAAGRDPKEILLVGATKMNDADRVREAIAAGLPCCGENRVQELLEKNEAGAYAGADLHFIGTLQKNKAKHRGRGVQVRLCARRAHPGAGKSGRISRHFRARTHDHPADLPNAGGKSPIFRSFATAFY